MQIKKLIIAVIVIASMLSALTANAATNLRSPYKGTNFIALVWDAPSGTPYSIYKNGVLTGSYTGGNNAAYYGLTPCTMYTFKVVDANGTAEANILTNC